MMEKPQRNKLIQNFKIAELALMFPVQIPTFVYSAEQSWERPPGISKNG